MTLAEPLRILLDLAGIFRSLEIRYFVGGSFASSLHGIPRATNDADLVIDMQTHQIRPFIQHIESTFYFDSPAIEQAVITRGSFNIIHLSSMFKIDVFIQKSDDNSCIEMERRQPFQVSDDVSDVLFMASAEDIIIRKLMWYQQGYHVSSRQWTDVTGVLQIRHKELDYRYLEKTAAERGVLKLLNRAVRDAVRDADVDTTSAEELKH